MLYYTILYYIVFYGLRVSSKLQELCNVEEITVREKALEAQSVSQSQIVLSLPGCEVCG